MRTTEAFGKILKAMDELLDMVKETGNTAERLRTLADKFKGAIEKLAI